MYFSAQISCHILFYDKLAGLERWVFEMFEEFEEFKMFEAFKMFKMFEGFEMLEACLLQAGISDTLNLQSLISRGMLHALQTHFNSAQRYKSPETFETT
jgi:hypothetical protein